MGESNDAHKYSIANHSLLQTVQWQKVDAILTQIPPEDVDDFEWAKYVICQLQDRHEGIVETYNGSVTEVVCDLHKHGKAFSNLMHETHEPIPTLDAYADVTSWGEEC